MPHSLLMENQEALKAHAPSDTFQLAPTTAFALVLETACEQFETLQLLISSEIKLVAPPKEDIQKHILYLRADACIRMALAKSFVANVIRARRIIEHGQEYLTVEKYASRIFITKTASLLRVRDVNEHGYDIKDNKSQPAMHFRGNSWGDETSLLVEKSNEIFMGPVNLYSIYLSTKRMRELAGFKVNPQLTFMAKSRWPGQKPSANRSTRDRSR